MTCGDHPAAAQLDALRHELERFAFRASSEAMLQAAVGAALNALGFPFRRERVLSPLVRLDFQTGRLAIECKISGSAADLTRQAARYLSRPELDGLLVVTTRSRHQALPSTLVGKPLRVLWLRSL
jgi:hypothetical protein